MTLGNLLGLGRPDTERMFGEDIYVPCKTRTPDLLRDPWCDLYGEEETLFLIDKEERKAIKKTIIAMVGRAK